MNEALRGLDFAALETLELVYRLRSFTAAAEALNIKQSSVSYTIDRLRKSFSDPLFVRQGNQISPTDRCVSIVKTAERILSEIEHASQPEEFELATVKATLAISATYLSRSVILPRFVQEIRTEAPSINIDLITGFTDAKQHLLAGSADMALSPVAINESGIYGKFLLEDPYVCLMDPENDLAQGDLTLERFAAAAHMIIHYGQRWHPPFRKMLKDLGHDIKPMASTANPEDVGLLVPNTDLVVTMPSRIARQFKPRFALRSCPVHATAQINLYWPARLNNSPLHIWLRDKIFRLALKASVPMDQHAI